MSASHEAPGLPEVKDEAGDSPRWLPWLGVGLFCLAAMLVAARLSLEPKPGAPGQDAAAGEQDAPAEGEAPAEAPAKPSAAP